MLIREFLTRENYFLHDALDYSYLKRFEQDPNAPRESNISGPGITFGTALDCLLFDGRKEFDNQFTFIQEPKPTASLLTLYDAVMEDYRNNVITSVDDISTDYLLDMINTLGLWSTIKDRKKLELKLTPDFILYLRKSIENSDKTILDVNDYYKVVVGCDYIKANKFTSEYFDEKKYEIKTQLAFSFVSESYGDNEMKAMLDLVCIDHVNKTVQPIDLKTTSESPLMFKANVIKYKYYLQAQLYTDGLKEWMKEHNLEGYSILPFKFIVLSSMEEYYKIPFVYNIGCISDFVDKLNRTSPFKYKTIYEIVDDYTKNKDYGFTYPVELYEKGFIEL